MVKGAVAAAEAAATHRTKSRPLPIRRQALVPQGSIAYPQETDEAEVAPRGIAIPDRLWGEQIGYGRQPAPRFRGFVATWIYPESYRAGGPGLAAVEE